MAWPRWYHITLTIHSHLHARTHMQNDAHRRLLTAVYVSWTEASGYNVQLLTRPHQHNFYGYHTPHKLTTIIAARITKHPVTNKDVTPQVCSCETQLMKKPTYPLNHRPQTYIVVVMLTKLGLQYEFTQVLHKEENNNCEYLIAWKK